VEIHPHPPVAVRPLGLFRRRRERAAVDAWLVERAHFTTADPRILRRVAELTSARRRLGLARSLRGAVRDSGRVGISASPLDRRAVAGAADELNDLAALLEDVSRPVTARGILLTTGLLTDGGSPLYGHGPVARLVERLATIRAVLEGR
jgi:hypothetical protein